MRGGYRNFDNDVFGLRDGEDHSTLGHVMPGRVPVRITDHVCVLLADVRKLASIRGEPRTLHILGSEPKTIMTVKVKWQGREWLCNRDLGTLYDAHTGLTYSASPNLRLEVDSAQVL